MTTVWLVIGLMLMLTGGVSAGVFSLLLMCREDQNRPNEGFWGRQSPVFFHFPLLDLIPASLSNRRSAFGLLLSVVFFVVGLVVMSWG